MKLNCSGESEPSTGVQTRHWNHKDRQWLVMICNKRKGKKDNKTKNSTEKGQKDKTREHAKRQQEKNLKRWNDNKTKVWDSHCTMEPLQIIVRGKGRWDVD